MQVFIWIWVLAGIGTLALVTGSLSFLLLNAHARELLGMPPCDKCRQLDSR